MSKREIVNVSVVDLTKYGFKDAAGYVSWSKDISENDKAAVVPGAIFEAEYYVSDKGTRYLNKIVKRTDKVDAPRTAAVSSEAPKPDVERAKKVDDDRARRFTPKYEKKGAVDNTMSKEEWAAKDQRISRQGVIQAAVIALAPVVALDKLEEEAVKMATAMLAFVNGGK
jgi:hypothetical protein